MVVAHTFRKLRNARLYAATVRKSGYVAFRYGRTVYVHRRMKRGKK
jgi:hypothetical protein